MTARTLMVQSFPRDETAGRRLAAALDAPFELIHLHRFPDGEILPRVPAGAATTVIYAALDRPNETLVALLFAADAWRRDPQVQQLVLTAPYLPYLRQDQVFHAGEPVSQAVVCRLLAERFDHIVCVDPHLHRTADLNAAYSGAIWRVLEGALWAAETLAREGVSPELVVVGPDVESTPLAARFAARLQRPHVVFSKVRRSDHVVELLPPPLTDLTGAAALIVDDICSSGGTLAHLAAVLRAMGAATVEALVTHALFNDEAAVALRAAGVARVRSCDGIVHPTNAIALAPLLARAVSEILESASKEAKS
jgi:ribose-phosphate pyrophosphokinase